MEVRTQNALGSAFEEAIPLVAPIQVTLLLFTGNTALGG